MVKLTANVVLTMVLRVSLKTIFYNIVVTTGPLVCE
jgi:hypothetical protein